MLMLLVLALAMSASALNAGGYDLNRPTIGEQWRWTQELRVTQKVVYLQFGKDSKTLAVGMLDGVLLTRDISRRATAKEVSMGREVRAYAPSTGGKVFALHADGSVGLRSSSSGEVAKSIVPPRRGAEPKALDLLPGFAGACWLEAFDEQARSYVYTRLDPTSGPGKPWVSPRPIAFCSARELAARWEATGKITVLDAKTRRALRQFAAGGDRGLISFSSDGTRIATHQADGTMLSIFSSANGKRLAAMRLPQGAYVTGLVMSPNNRHIAVVYASAQVELFSTSSGRIVGDTGPRGSYYAAEVAFAPDSRSVAVYNADDRTVRVYPVP